MTITAITQQARHAGRFSVFIDDQFAFGLSADRLAELGLRPSQPLSEAELREIERKLEFDTVKRSALRTLELRMNSEHELREKLRRKEYEPALIDDVVAWLKQRGLIDDRAFAERWVESRRQMQQLGDFRLKQELFKKGIPSEVVSAVLSQETEPEEAQVGRAARWAARRYASLMDRLDDQTVSAKVLSAIVRRGFSYQIAKKALALISQRQD